MEVPEFFHAAASFCLPEKREPKPVVGDHFAVEDLFDFSNDDAVLTDALTVDTESSTVTVADATFLPNNNNNATDSGNANFSGELGVPYEDLAELEWLSNFVEESFSSEDLQKLQLISGQQQQARNSSPIFNPDVVAVPGKARSKRSRATPCKWASPLISPSPATSSSEPPPPDSLAMPVKKAAASKKKDHAHNNDGTSVVEGRKCVHCATDKTPQWRTGPMGPKTLCNACGVRYKSGRLVPEYRPASSPTFVLTKHSNSHRKVMELRQQKEMQMAQQQQQQQQQHFMQHHHHHQTAIMFEGDDYLIHHPDFRQLI